MALLTTTFNKSNDPYIDNLIYSQRERWGTGNGVTVTYSFPQNVKFHIGNGDAKNTFAAVTDPNMQNLITKIFQGFEAVANVTFRLIEETATDHAVMPIAYTDLQAVSNPGSVAFDSAPSSSDITGGDLWISGSQKNSSFKAGTSIYHTIIHEIGHGMGLKHTQDYPAVPLDHDSQIYSVMSYTGYRNAYMIPRGNTASDFHPETLMLDDIRALQYMYGPSFRTNSGDTTYKWKSSTGELTTADKAPDGSITSSALTPSEATNKILMTIWDGDGNDTYDFSDYTTSVNVNLQPGAWTTTAASQLVSYDVEFGPPAAPPGNIANAYLYVDPLTHVVDLRSLIENATGGSGSDVIIGNQTKNKLIGGRGDDKLYGLDDADTLEGGEGADYLSGDAGDDSLLGEAGNDSLYGGDGADTLDGGAGDDLLRGGAGDDTYKFGLGSGQDVIIQGDGGADKLVFDAGVAAGSITWTRSGFDLIATLTGGSDKVTLKNWYWGDAYKLKVYLGGTELNLSSVLSKTDDTVALATAPATGGSTVAGTKPTLLMGSDNQDTLNGGIASDTLIGGKGNDTLKGGLGNDLYIFNRGDGADVISDDGGYDTLSFGYGVSASDISISMSANNIIVYLRNSPDKITIQDWMINDKRIETFNFADGTSLALRGIISRLGTDGADTIDLSSWADAVQLNSGKGNDTVTCNAGDDVINGGEGNDTISGGAGNDLITGDDGADQLTGGRGNDTLLGGGGDGTYIFNTGDGKDWIYDYYVTPVTTSGGGADANAGSDTLSFGAGITIDNILVTMNYSEDTGRGHLVIGLKLASDPSAQMNALTDTVTIFDWLNSNHRIEKFQFSDGSIYTAEQVVSHMGTSGDDQIKWTSFAVTLNGGGGNDALTAGQYSDSLNGDDGKDTLDGGGVTGGGVDTLRGGAGDDLYLFGKGSGKVLIIQGDGGADQLQFKAGVGGVRYTVTWARSGDDLIGTVVGSASDQVTIKNYYLGGSYSLKYFYTIETGAVARTVTGTSSNDSMIGSSGDDTLYGAEGDDTLVGSNGNDQMYGGKGDDIYYVGVSSRLLERINSASDIVFEEENSGTDTGYSYLADYTMTANVENLVLLSVNLDGGASLVDNA